MIVFILWEEFGLLESDVSGDLASARSVAQRGQEHRGLCSGPEVPTKAQARRLAVVVETSGQAGGLSGRAVRTC